jgi:hypothetical protein
MFCFQCEQTSNLPAEDPVAEAKENQYLRAVEPAGAMAWNKAVARIWQF